MSLIVIMLSSCFMTNCNEQIKQPNAEKINIDIDYGFIEIPKIKLQRKFVYDASIEKEISMLPISEYPSKPNSLLVLAAHSGNSVISYFNYLYKLKPDDKIYINYSNQIYEYKIIDIYNQKKDGNVDIYRIYNKRTLVLVTCTNNKKGWQTVYIAIQINN